MRTTLPITRKESDPPWSTKMMMEDRKNDREEKRKRKEYFNILLGKQYNLLRL